MEKSKRRWIIAAAIAIAGLSIGAYAVPVRAESRTIFACEQDICKNNKCEDATSTQKGCNVTGAFTCETYNCGDL